VQRYTPARPQHQRRSVGSWFPFALAVVIGCQLAVLASLTAALAGPMPQSPPGLSWLLAAAVGQSAMAAVSVGMLITRAARPTWRRATAGWVMVALEVGWLLLTAELTGPLTGR
jgi:hypothetical protein